MVELVRGLRVERVRIEKSKRKKSSAVERKTP